MRGIYEIVISLLAIGALSALGATPDTQAQRLFKRLTGTPIPLLDPRLHQMTALIEKGDLKGAAAIATADDAFLRVTVQNFAGPLANQMFSPYDPVNDFTALYMGIARDDRDARELLTANYLYSVPETKQREFGPALKHFEVLPEVQPYAAGLLTTDAWAKSHLEGGTNRRPIKFAFQVFLCTPINQWREKDIPDRWVRRDVDRQPGGNPETYQNLCSTCHARMDALAGAFARLDYTSGALRYTGPNYVARKVNQNAGVARDDGNMVMNDEWEAIPSDSFQNQFGFRTALTGKGPKQLGALIANSERFKSCMAERVFEKTCRRKPTAEERTKEIAALATRFEASGYKLRDLFESTAVLPACRGGESGGKLTLSLANFREARESLAVVTGVDPTVKDIDTYYKEAITRLPKDGKKEELNETSLLALTGLSALYCKEWIQNEKKVEPAARKVHDVVAFDQAVNLTTAQQQALSTAYARVFWQRSPTEKETNLFIRTYAQLRADLGDKASWEAVLLPLCTSVAGSLQTWIR